MADDYTLTVSSDVPFVRRLVLARMVAGLTRRDIARAIGISYRTYCRMEEGVREARRGELIAIAQITGQPQDYFFDNTSPAAILSGDGAAVNEGAVA